MATATRMESGISKGERSAAVGDVFDADALTDVVRSIAPQVVIHQPTDLRGGNRSANARIRETGTHNLVAAAVRRIEVLGLAVTPQRTPG